MCDVSSGDGGDGALPRWSTDHAPRPDRLLVKQRHDGERPWRGRLPVAADRRARTTHQSHAHQLRPRQRADRLDPPPPHARPDAARRRRRRRREAEAEGLLPAGEPTRTPLHPSSDRV